MKFILKGLHEMFDAEIPIGNELNKSINEFIRIAEKRATKGTMITLNAIKNEENLISEIDKDERFKEIREKYIKKQLKCRFNDKAYDMAISFIQLGDRSFLNTQEFSFHPYSGMKKGMLEIIYNNKIYEMNYSYTSKNLFKQISIIPFELDH